jgi:hypothetical protein
MYKTLCRLLWLLLWTFFHSNDSLVSWISLQNTKTLFMHTMGIMFYSPPSSAKVKIGGAICILPHMSSQHLYFYHAHIIQGQTNIMYWNAEGVQGYKKIADLVLLWRVCKEWEIFKWHIRYVVRTCKNCHQEHSVYMTTCHAKRRGNGLFLSLKKTW